MNLIELVRDMVLNYYQLTGDFPGKIIIGKGARRQWDEELVNIRMKKGFLKEEKFMGVNVVFDNEEKFVRLECKK